MSGGVDSAVAAARAVEAGHDVVGVHLVGGLVGTVLIGLFANVTRDADGVVTSDSWAPDGALDGLFYGAAAPSWSPRSSSR